ncbi:hypothetical protein M5E89_00830 [Acidaminococcus intestini]|nr:hypothetical protein M5E89_00830 [Acidaminococcus intestini]
MKMRRLLTAFLVAMIALPVSLGFAAKKNAPSKSGIRDGRSRPSKPS